MTELRFERFDQPVGQVVAVQFHQVFGFDLIAAFEPVDFLIRQGRHQKLAVGSKAKNRQSPLRRTVAMLSQVGKEVFLAQHRVNGFSQRGTLTRAEPELAEILRQHHVGGLVKFKNVLE